MSSQVRGKTHHNGVYGEGGVADGATVTPGMGIERTGTDADGKPTVQPVSTIEPADAQARFAIEQRLPPRSEGEEMLEDEYEAGNYLQFFVFQRGDVVENALVASGQDLADNETVGGAAGSGSGQATIEAGDSLAFFSDGTLKVAQDGAAAVAEAREAVDNSGAASGEYGRVSIEAL